MYGAGVYGAATYGTPRDVGGEDANSGNDSVSSRHGIDPQPARNGFVDPGEARHGLARPAAPASSPGAPGDHDNEINGRRVNDNQVNGGWIEVAIRSVAIRSVATQPMATWRTATRRTAVPLRTLLPHDRAAWSTARRGSTVRRGQRQRTTIAATRRPDSTLGPTGIASMTGPTPTASTIGPSLTASPTDPDQSVTYRRDRSATYPAGLWPTCRADRPPESAVRVRHWIAAAPTTRCRPRPSAAQCRRGRTRHVRSSTR